MWGGVGGWGGAKRDLSSDSLEFQKSKWKNIFVYRKNTGENWSASLMARILSISLKCSHRASFHWLAVGSAWEALSKISQGRSLIPWDRLSKATHPPYLMEQSTFPLPVPCPSLCCNIGVFPTPIILYSARQVFSYVYCLFSVFFRENVISTRPRTFSVFVHHSEKGTHIDALGRSRA